MQSKDMQTLMLNLEKWRVQHSLSQNEFAKKIKLSVSTYNRLVIGEVDKLSVDTLKAIYFTTGHLCYQLMECCEDDYLRLGNLCRKLNESELRYMLYMTQNLILMREGKL